MKIQFKNCCQAQVFQKLCNRLWLLNEQICVVYSVYELSKVKIFDFHCSFILEK